jgi:hypothetical protein
LFLQRAKNARIEARAMDERGAGRRTKTLADGQRASLCTVADFGIDVLETQERYWRQPCYTATAERFLASGLLQASQIPGEIACPRSRVYRFARDGREYTVTRGWKLSVVRYFCSRGTDEEVAARQAEYEQQDAAEQAKYRAQSQDFWRRNNERLAKAEVESEVAEEEAYSPTIDDDDDWPPHVGHNPAIQIGDGSRWHYKGTAEALLLAGVLDANQIPGNPACKGRSYCMGWHEEIAFIATCLGKHIAVTLLGKGASMMRCVPLKFKAR